MGLPPGGAQPVSPKKNFEDKILSRVRGETPLNNPKIPLGTYYIRKNSAYSAEKDSIVYTICYKRQPTANDKDAEKRAKVEITKDGYKTDQGTFPTLEAAISKLPGCKLDLGHLEKMDVKLKELTTAGTFNPQLTKEQAAKKFSALENDLKFNFTKDGYPFIFRQDESKPDVVIYSRLAPNDSGSLFEDPTKIVEERYVFSDKGFVNIDKQDGAAYADLKAIHEKDNLSLSLPKQEEKVLQSKLRDNQIKEANKKNAELTALLNANKMAAMDKEVDANEAKAINNAELNKISAAPRSTDKLDEKTKGKSLKFAEDLPSLPKEGRRLPPPRKPQKPLT